MCHQERTVLLADDDIGMRMVLELRLRQAGYNVVSARGGSEAVKLFESHKPDAVILDAAMPDKSGFDVCDAIRSTDRGRNLPIVFLSGAATPSTDYVQRCADAVGASRFLRKPCDCQELVELLEQMTAAVGETPGDDVMAPVCGEDT